MIPHRRKPGGFTLIEILVVVAIIVVLISILIPALGAAKKRARIVDTTSLMDNLQTDIEAYYQQFNAYPGPFPTAQTTSGNSTLKLSGTQNLLLGLTYALREPADVAPNVVATTGFPAVQLGSVPPAVIINWIDPTVPNGPLDRGSQSPSNAYNQLSPFFTPTKRELSPSTTPSSQLWLPTGIAANTAIPFNKFNFPTIIDHFPDPLPILYYRKTPGVEGTATAVDNKGNVQIQAAGTAAAPAIAITNPTVGIASYYLDENKEYTDGSVTITSPSGSSFPQAGAAGGGLTPNQLASFACTVIPPVPPSAVSTATSRGGYVLISAGPSRTYGVAVNASVSDNIVVVGGQ